MMASTLIGKQAVVIGAGIGGLTAAAAIAGFFDQVFILERDILPSEAAHRAADSGACPQRGRPSRTPDDPETGLPKYPTGSTGRRNTSIKSLCWGFKLQGLTWSFVYARTYASLRWLHQCRASRAIASIIRTISSSLISSARGSAVGGDSTSARNLSGSKPRGNGLATASLVGISGGDGGAGSAAVRHTPAHHRHFEFAARIADHGSRIVWKHARHRCEVADVTVDDTKFCRRRA